MTINCSMRRAEEGATVYYAATLRPSMSDESYRKCRTCRLCRHEGDSWNCVPEGRPTGPDSTCGRYRPGCCENCSFYGNGVCSASGRETYELDVCGLFDPSGPA